ncbi:MAG: DUF349 domain-containing protein [Bacteroidales bacterium]|nr:DUF349 domain-containing protein [Bacteroidales bacterium]
MENEQNMDIESLNKENLQEQVEQLNNDSVQAMVSENAEKDQENVSSADTPTTLSTQEETTETEPFDETIFDTYNKEELIQAMEACAKETDVVKIKKQVSLLRSRFLQLLKESKDQAREVFLSEGGTEEDFKYQPDDLDKRFDEAFGFYKANKNRYTELLEKEKEENLQKKLSLLDELKELVDSEQTLKQIYDKFNEIHNKWKEIGAVPQANTNELWQNYHFYVEKFFNKVKMNRELRDLDMKKNLEQKLNLCEKAEALLLEPSITESFKLLQQYHQEWKEIGAVEEDKKEELWNRFKMISDQINQKRKEHYEQLAKEQENNYQAKVALCEQIESLLSEDYKSTLKALSDMETKVVALFDMWKTIGPASKQQNNDIWQRFHRSLDKFYEDKQELYKKNKEEKVNNYNLKVNLCLQAEAIATRTDWKKATAELLQLQEEWKKIGGISKKQSEQLWTRFRKACDDFFAAKSEYFKNFAEQSVENIEKRKAVIQKAKDFVIGTDRKESIEALKNIQREWTEIGYTSPAEKTKLQQEFDEIINKYFSELKTSAGEENFAEKVSKWKEEGSTSQLIAARKKYQKEIETITKDLCNLENNMLMFGKTTKSEVLRPFELKIQHMKDEIAKWQEKLTIVEKEIKEMTNNKKEQ